MEMVATKREVLTECLEYYPSMIIVSDIRGEIIQVNNHAEEIFGESLTGKKIDEIFPELNKDKFSRLPKLGKYSFESKIKNEVYVINSTYNPKENIIYHWGSNITNYKKMYKVQQILFYISNAITKTKNVTELIKKIHQYLKQVIDAENMYVAIYDEKTETYSFPYFSDVHDNYESLDKVELANSPTDYVRRTSLPLVLNSEDIRSSDKFVMVGTIPKIWIGLPLISNEKTIGVFCIQDYGTESENLKNHREFLTIVASNLAAAIERKFYDMALQERENNFNIISNTSIDAVIIMDSCGRITSWNNAAINMFGYKTSEILGLQLKELINTNKFAENIDLMINEVSDHELKIDQDDIMLLEASRKNGEIFQIEIYLSSMKLDNNYHLVAFVRDVSDRIKRESEFNSKVAKYISMINTVPAMMYLKDLNHKYLIANENFCSTVGLTLEQIRGKTDFDILPPEKAEINHKDDLMVIETKQPVMKHEEPLTDANGEIKWHSTTKVPIYDSFGKINGVVGLTQDITELHVSREKLIQSDKLAAIGTLAAGVAHEINNPIGFINSNLNTMTKYLAAIDKYIKSTEIEDIHAKDNLIEMLTDFKDAIEESQEGTERVKKIVSDLKGFSRVDKAEKEEVNINDGIESTLNIVWNELKYKCTVEKDLGDIPFTFCFPNQINQVFMNLLVNSGHAIEGDKGHIKIKTWNDDTYIYISIEDNGCGIEENNLKKIFEPFFTTKEVGKGTGLGLSLVYEIIQKHDGTIDVESTVGKGTKFTVTIPRCGTENE